MKKSIRILAIISIMFFLVALTSCENSGSTSLGTYQLTLVNLANNEEIEINHEWNSNFTVEELAALNIPDGYYIEIYDENSQKINIKTNVKLERVYYRILPNKYDLTFIGDRGRILVTEVEYNTDISEYADENSANFVRAEKTGYNFIGWNEEGANVATLYALDKMPAHDLTLKANFEKADYNFTVHLNVPSEIANDPALIGVVDPIINTTHQYKDRLINFLTVAQKNLLTSFPNYVFGGWYLDSNFQTAFTDISMPDKDIELWGRWYNMGINLIDGNHVIVNLTGEPNQPIALPSQYTTYYKEGYNFLGWYEKDAEGNYYDNAYDFTSIPSGVVSLYAKYEAVDVNYLVKHHFENLSGGYEVENEPLIAKTGTLVNATVITRTGFQKVVNHQAEHLSGIVLADGTLVLDVYYERLTYVVTFNLNNGSPNIIRNVKYQAAAVAPDTPTKSSDAEYSYVFLEWDAQFNNITSAITVNAVYTRNERTYTVKFYEENGTTELASNVVDYNSLVGATEPTPTKAADNHYTYTFNGWVAMNNSPSYSATNAVTDDFSYKASWTASAINYDLVYNLNGRTDASAVTNDTYSASDLPSLAAPTSTSHNFVGWFTKDGEGDDWGTQVSSLSVTDYGNKTLYAKWAIKTFTVKFYDENGTTELASTVVNYDSLVGATEPTPTKAPTDMLSYTFNNWVKMTNEPDYVATNKVTSNLSYKASYTASNREYTITYVLNGGTWSEDAGANTYIVGSIVTYNLVNKTNCIFEGWYTKDGTSNDWGDKVTGITVSEYGDKTVYAKWIEPKTIQELLDAEASTDIWYIVTGKVGAIADANALKYGNFDLIDLDDPTIKIYVYGVANADKEKGKFAEMNIFEGDTITIIANWKLYNTTKELENAYYVSHSTKTLTDTERVTRDADRMTDYSGTKKEDFTVPTIGTSGTTFTWSSSNPAVLSISGGNITVTPGATDTILVLTVTVSYGGATPVPINFDVMVPTQPIAGETVIYSTDFEDSAYVASTTYNKPTAVTFNDWSTIMGTVSATNPINGTKSMQMRSYDNRTNIGLTTTINAYDQVTRFTFNAKSSNGTPTMVVKYNVAGVSYSLTERSGRTISTAVQEFEYVLPSITSGVRIEIYNETVNVASRLYIDDVKIYGIPSTATEYSVTYDANTGSGTMTDTDSPYSASAEVTVKANEFTAPDGKVFDKWNTAANGTGDDYAPNDTFNISANTTLYAQWKIATVIPDLFFSEYGEGTSYNKWVEIYNPTAAAINLKNYKIQLYSNGGTTANTTLTWSTDTMIAAGRTYVIYHGSANATISAKGQLSSSVVNYNGDDAIALCKGSDIIDLIGVIGESPATAWTGNDSTGAAASTVDKTLVRIPSVKCGNTTFTWSEWTVYPEDTFTYIGEHTIS